MDRLMPRDVRNVSFGKPPPGRRGYDESEVDEFLDLVERTLSQLYHEIGLLRDEPTTPGGVGGMQLALTGTATTLLPALPAGRALPAGPYRPSDGPETDGPGGPAENAILAELDQIKRRLARIESAVTAPIPAGY